MHSPSVIVADTARGFLSVVMHATPVTMRAAHNAEYLITRGCTVKQDAFTGYFYGLWWRCTVVNIHCCFSKSITRPYNWGIFHKDFYYY